MLLATIRQALDTMRRHRLWAILTISGIVWGTASVVLLVGWGVGVHVMIDGGLQKVGKNLVYLIPGQVSEDLAPADFRRALKFELEDARVLRASAPHIELVSAEMQDFMYAASGASSHLVDTRGVEPQMMDLRGVSIAEGRWISPQDVSLGRRVAVIGQTARERLLGRHTAVGRQITLNGQTFEVIGLLARVGAQLSRDNTLIDEQVWIPITTFRNLTGRKSLNLIVARPPNRKSNEQVKQEARRILSQRLHVSPEDQEAIQIVSLIDYLSGFDAVFAAFNAFLTVLAIATLAIGGIGVMNMMLVSVNERRREIALRLAVGARRSQVVGQFLAETLVITSIGGIAGTTLGILACAALSTIHADVVPTPHIIPGIVALALASTVAVGIASGCIPAWRVSAIDPAETLRSG